MKSDFIVILTTCKNRRQARDITDLLLKKRLVACANIMPGVESKFWWGGKLDEAKEVLVMMKTRKENFEVVEKNIKRLHSYEVPEIIAMPIVDGSRYYLNWVDSSVGQCQGL